MAIFLSRCRPQRRSQKTWGNCSQCIEYFATLFGEEAAYEIGEKFLEYKERIGLRRRPIDPETIHHDEYITEDELVMLGARRIKVPFRNPPMSANPPRPHRPHRAPEFSHARQVRKTTLVDHPSTIRQPPPAVRRTRFREDLPERQATVKGDETQVQAKPRSTKSRGIKHADREDRDACQVQTRPLITRKPVPRRPVEDVPLVTIPAMIYPLHENRTFNPVAPSYLRGTPYDSHELQEYPQHHQIRHGRALTCTPQQPRALRSRDVPKEQESQCSLVKRFTRLAEQEEESIDVGYSNPESSSLPKVPHMSKAPKIPHWRHDTPHPNAGLRKGKDIIPSSPSPILASMSVAAGLRSAPMYVVHDQPSIESLRGDIRSTVPPPRIASGSPDYREHGVPTAAHLHDSIQVEYEQDRLSPPPKLVSVSTPSPAYSCATQACWCHPDDPDTDVCPACLERRRLGKTMQMQWI
ncbi:hypothetical protein F4819DRAFT_506517 [Hypoxylon fuscum]|nr:hypothetical protein F4819DRAFT_506517 [Hypoxylon fuscum]